MNHAVRGIVLDAVGTIIEPVPSVSQVYAMAALRQGIEIDLDEVRARFRIQFATDEIDEKRGPLSTSEAIERKRWRRIVARCLPELPDPDLAFAELWDHFGSPSSWRVFPDVEPTVAALLRGGLRICVASNFDARLRPVLRGLASVADWAEPLVISSEVGYRKPHANFYQAACERLQLPPDNVLCVGDDAENDVRGPLRAGLRAVLIARNGHAPPGIACLSSLEALVPMLLPADVN